MWISRGMTKLLFLLKLLFRKTPVQVRWNIEAMFLCCWISHDMSFCVTFFILEVVSQFLSDSELNTTWNRKKLCCSQGLWGSGSPWSNDPSYVTTLLKYNSIFATPVRRTNDGASTGYKGCEEAVMAIFLAATKQLYKWYFPSVCPSVCLSVCHTFLTMFPSSYHHEIFRSYYQRQKWRPCKRSRSEVKGQGHRGHNPT